MDLRDGIVCSPHGPEPIGDRQEVGLKDRLQHQLQRRLDHPIGHGCNTEASHLPDPPGLGVLRSRTGSGRNVPVFSWARRSSTNPRTPMRSSTSATLRPSTPGVLRAPVARDPVKRHDQRRRVMHEVEQIIEPAARISRRPTVKLGLHLRYP